MTRAGHEPVVNLKVRENAALPQPQPPLPLPLLVAWHRLLAHAITNAATAFVRCCHAVRRHPSGSNSGT